MKLLIQLEILSFLGNCIPILHLLFGFKQTLKLLNSLFGFLQQTLKLLNALFLLLQMLLPLLTSFLLISSISGAFPITMIAHVIVSRSSRLPSWGSIGGSRSKSPCIHHSGSRSEHFRLGKRNNATASWPLFEIGAVGGVFHG